MFLTHLKSHKSIYTIIAIELIIASFLGYKIIKKNNNILGTVSVNPILKENIQHNPGSSLKHFYEPIPGNTETVNTWVEYAKPIKINMDGLNDRLDYEIEYDKSSTYRIITLGDSYTYGLYVDTPDNWTEKLEDALNNQCNKYKTYEVINLGVPGYDIQYSMERFKTKGIKYDPQLIIWYLKNDDMAQINEIMFPLEKKYSEEMRKSGEFQREVDKGHLYPSWDKAMLEVLNTIGESKILSIQQSLLQDFTQIYQGKIYLITETFTDIKYMTILQQYADSHASVNLFTLSNSLNKIKDATFPNDGHPTKTGHTIIANDLIKGLISDKIFECD